MSALRLPHPPAPCHNGGADHVFKDLLRALESEHVRLLRQCEDLTLENAQLKSGGVLPQGHKGAAITPKRAKSTDSSLALFDIAFSCAQKCHRGDAIGEESPLPKVHAMSPPPLEGEQLKTHSFCEEFAARKTSDHSDGTLDAWADQAEQSTAPDASVSRLKFRESVEQTGTLGDIELDQGLIDMEAMQQEVIEVFNEIDRDKSGSLSMDELHRALIAAGVAPARLAKLFQEVDKDRDGSIELHEWIRAINRAGPAELRVISENLAAKLRRDGKLYHAPLKYYCMMHPNSHFRLCWDCLIVLICIYIGVVLPFVVAWSDSLSTNGANMFQIIDQVINYVFIIDILLAFRTGYINGDNDLVMQWEKVARKYLKTWFLFDLVSALPLDLITNQDVEEMRGFKLLKLGRLIKIAKVMDSHVINIEDVSDTLADISESKLVRLLRRRCHIFLNMLFLCHWLACGMKVIDEGFLSTYADVSGSMSAEYLAALYWAMTTVTTVGYGDIIPSSDTERIYCCTAMVVGGAFYGYVVGSITSMVASADLNSAAYYERMDLIHAWLTHHHLPMQMKRSLRRYFQHYLSDKCAISEADIWHDLSPEMQRVVGDFIIHRNVKMNPIFDGLTMGTVVHLQSILQRVTILDGRTVTEKGEVGTAMYIIVEGELQMHSDSIMDYQPTAQSFSPQENSKWMGVGQSFGEEILLGFEENYQYTVTVLYKAKLEMISENAFSETFQYMPNVLEKMRQNALEMNPHWSPDRKSKFSRASANSRVSASSFQSRVSSMSQKS